MLPISIGEWAPYVDKFVSIIQELINEKWFVE
ncbi:MAG: hypothetical protein KatS3mg003_2073 [Candidatus Nitrosocaldaceae archaeon]|nr:MAG: hypothetical protein KatS3mg003_2073 [Candidatus Nitrosocaldaceae archaeon]